MIYHKYAAIGGMLWIKYGLLKGKLFKNLSEIYHEYLESLGTKAYTVSEAKELAKSFRKCDASVQLSFGDLLEGFVGARHKGILLRMMKLIYPRTLVKLLGKLFSIGLF